MGRRKSLKTEAKDYVIQATGCGIVFYCISAATAYYGDGYFDLVWPALAAASAPVITRMLNNTRSPQLAFSFGSTVDRQPFSLNKRRNSFESLVKWSTGGYDPDINEPMVSRQIRYDEPPPVRDYIDVQLTNRQLPVRIFLDDLYGFVNAVSRRQRNGHPYPFSRNHFTPRPYSQPEYNAMVEILTICGLIYNRGQGAKTKLTYPRQVSFSVEYARRSFSTLLH